MTPATQGLEGLLNAIQFTRELLSRKNGKPGLIEEFFSDYGGQKKIAHLRGYQRTELGPFVEGYATELTNGILELLTRDSFDAAEVAAFDAVDELLEQVHYLLCGPGGMELLDFSDEDMDAIDEQHMGCAA